MGEIEVTSLQRPDRIVVRKVVKQICNFGFSCLGDYMSIFFVFPRVKFYEQFIARAPSGYTRTANKSG